MAWRRPTLDDLCAVLSDEEMTAYRSSSPASGADPVEDLIAQSADLIRGYCRTGAVVLPDGQGLIPASLIGPAMDITAYNVLKRLPIEIGEDRRRAYDRAMDILKDVAAGRFRPEPFEKDDGTQSASVLPCFGDYPIPRRVLE